MVSKALEASKQNEARHTRLSYLRCITFSAPDQPPHAVTTSPSFFVPKASAMLNSAMIQGLVERTLGAVLLAGNGNDRGRPRRRRPNGVNIPRPVFGGGCLVEEGSASLPVF